MSNFKYSNSDSLVRHLYNFIGDTVTIFTTSGGASGGGFTGTLLSVNSNFVRLLTKMGDPPPSPLSGSFRNCPENAPLADFGNFGVPGGSDNILMNKHKNSQNNEVGSICDIPVDRIAAFCHKAV